MGGEWTTIGAIAEVFDGPHATPKKIKEGPYFLSISSLENGKLDLSKSARVSEDQFVKWTKRVTPSKGDVLFSYETRLGEAALMPSGIRACLGRRMGLLRPDTGKVDPRYLLFAYLGPDFQREIRARTNSGATVDRIALKELPVFPLRIPPLDDQKSIAHILGSLDDKIELNRQMNTTLEAMAQALFKSWFVDFDPVIDNALAAGNPIPEPLHARAETRKALGDKRKPLPAAIHQQFPSRFVFSEEMGWIPEGWEIVVSGNVIDVRDGTHDSPKKAMSGYPLVTSRHITSGTLRLSEAYLISDVDYKKVNQRSQVEHGDILLTMIGTVGIPYLVMQAEVNFAIKNVGLFRTSQAPLYRHYFFQLLKSQEMQNYLDARMAGTTQKYLSLKALRNIEFVSPGEQLLSNFNDHVFALMNQLRELEEESSTLVALRDTLLPQLLSGELPIPEAEKLMEQAL